MNPPPPSSGELPWNSSTSTPSAAATVQVHGEARGPALRGRGLVDGRQRQVARVGQPLELVAPADAAAEAAGQALRLLGAGRHALLHLAETCAQLAGAAGARGEALL